ncbi:hypothetical protein L249_4185 [Ophiocordyceps polyrhachis-furcata BCC 54312]|uniref:Uncharacterized protein n=1 Tax=Ophiocordyceps polyrhachis-furcata BCC 54312 TaxID=1330021 RepID=A0A367LBU5_9HYPO|nr:hypothetical protein L249_4185 [Ophiocordyceps polyrhachis-furcata BCC 54312]
MLTRRLIVLLKKARLACPVLKRTSVPRLPDLPYVPSLVRPVRPVQPRLLRCCAVPTSVTFLPIVVTYSRCDVRRPRAGCSRPGVTVSGAPAKLLPTA